jgi:hypothetical protein
MRLGLTAIVALAATACSIPGVRPEGREIGLGGREVPAERSAVFDRAVTWFGPRYTVVSSDRPERIRAERRVDATHVNVLDVRFADGAAGRTTMTINAWTDVTKGLSRRRATSYEATLPIDVHALNDFMSCATARWPACP